MDILLASPSTPKKRVSKYNPNVSSTPSSPCFSRSPNASSISMVRKGGDLRFSLEGIGPSSSPKKQCVGTRVFEEVQSSVDNQSLDNKLTQTPTSSSKADRFIPNRNFLDLDYCNYYLTNTNHVENVSSDDPNHQMQEKLKSAVLETGNQTPGRRLITCFEKISSNQTYSEDNGLENVVSPKVTKQPRHLPTGPCKLLDAPDIVDDYYLNLLSWGSNNVIAIALNKSVYMWNATDSRVDQLLTLEEENDYVTSVQWNSHDNTLAVGTFSNEVQLWDCAVGSKIRDLPGHHGRVSSLSWNDSSLLSSGSRDSSILNHDIRQRRNVQSTYLGHQQEVCGLAWSPDGRSLASGGNENVLCIWDIAASERMSIDPSSLGSSASRRQSRVLTQNSNAPKFKIEKHQAAVKALAWCPFQRHVLASGGGTADRTIRLWNASSGCNLSTIDTGSQVCAMQWSETHRELVSSHGFSNNQLILWKYCGTKDNLRKIKEFRGHTSRVLHLAKSPDGSTIASAGADETLRFWELFSHTPNSRLSTPSKVFAGESAQLLPNCLSIR